MLNLVEFHTKRDLVKINPEKSEILNYKHKNEVEVLLEVQTIGTVKTIKHLGLNRNPKNDADIDRRLQTANKPYTLY